MSDDRVLDHAVWASLVGAHATLAHRCGQAARYPVDMSPFAALDPAGDPAAWDDLAQLVGPGGQASLFGEEVTPPPGWELLAHGRGVQMTGEDLDTDTDTGDDAVPLTPADAPDALDLVSRARPGPFLPRTLEMGSYLGVRDGGVLVAMAGERLHPPGWTEISAVCTDAEHRGRGLASRLVRAVGAGIRARGEIPFLHAAETNESAIRLYLSIGFRLRRTVTFALVQAPPVT